MNESVVDELVWSSVMRRLAAVERMIPEAPEWRSVGRLPARPVGFTVVRTPESSSARRSSAPGLVWAFVVMALVLALVMGAILAGVGTQPANTVVPTPMPTLAPALIFASPSPSVEPRSTGTPPPVVRGAVPPAPSPPPPPFIAPAGTPDPDPTAPPTPSPTPSPKPTPSPTPPIVPSPVDPSIHVAVSGMRLPAPRSRAVALRFGAEFLVCGGLNGAGGATASITRIDLRARRVSALGLLKERMHSAAGAVIGTNGFIFGGSPPSSGSSVERVGPNGASRALGGLLPADRIGAAAVNVGGRILILGGGPAGSLEGRILATRDGHTFKVIGRLLVKVRYPAVATFGGIVYVIGGRTLTGDARAIQAINPATGVVRLVGRLDRGMSHAVAVVVGGDLLIAGGRTSGKAQDRLLRVDVATGSVNVVGRLPYKVSDMAVGVYGRTAYLIGGEGAHPLATIIMVTVDP